MDYRTALFTPRGFLMVGGAVLAVLGLIGFVCVEQPIPFLLLARQQREHCPSGSRCRRAGRGVCARPEGHIEPYYKWIVVLVGVIALFFGVYGFLVPRATRAAQNTFGLANLELGDNLLHLVVAGWAFLAAFWSPQAAMERR